jgi:hypothetical protein
MALVNYPLHKSGTVSINAPYRSRYTTTPLTGATTNNPPSFRSTTKKMSATPTNTPSGNLSTEFLGRHIKNLVHEAITDPQDHRAGGFWQKMYVIVYNIMAQLAVMTLISVFGWFIHVLGNQW